MMAGSMKLLWSSRSPFARKVMVAAHEVGVAARIATQRVVVSANKPSAEVMALNPLNKIPTLVLQDGTPLYDSRVICEFLDSLHDGPKLLPPDGAAAGWHCSARHSATVFSTFSYSAWPSRTARASCKARAILQHIGSRSRPHSIGSRPKGSQRQSAPMLAISPSAAPWDISIFVSLRITAGPAAGTCQPGMPTLPAVHRCGRPSTLMLIDRRSYSRG